MLYFCHNCGASMSFGNFLKQYDPQLYQEYNQEKFLNKQEKQAIKETDITKIVWPKFRTDSPLRLLKKISQLDPDHPAKRYVVKRKIPTTYHHKLCYAPKFKQWINSVLPGKFNVEQGDEPRLIIPFIDKEMNCFGVQGRSFKPDGLRYITIMFDESKPKIFGLDTVNFSLPVFVLEGPIDSMFIENAIAMAGADVDLSTLNLEKKNITFIYDNEPRNEQIVKRMEKTIDIGYNVVIWPEDIQTKDVNDMALLNINVSKIIKESIFSGLEAKVKLMQWKRT